MAWAGEPVDGPPSVSRKIRFHAEQTASPGFTIGLDLLGNAASEFWPDVKHIVFRRR
jgi:hypothetical protein